MSLWQAKTTTAFPLTSARVPPLASVWYRAPGDDGSDLFLPMSGAGAQTPAGISTARSFAWIIGCLFMLLALG